MINDAKIEGTPLMGVIQFLERVIRFLDIRCKDVRLKDI